MNRIFLSSLRKEDLSFNNDVWLNELRERALECYQSLPNEVSPLYNKYTNTTALKPDLIFFDDDEEQPSQSILNRFKDVQGAAVLSINNKTYINIPKELSKKGVIIKNIMDVLKENTKLRYVINRIDPLEDKFLALESSLFNSGVFIYIPPNLMLDEPITIIHEQGKNGSSSVLRNIFYLEESSNATVIHELYSNYSGSNQQVLFELNESFLANNSEFNHITLQAMNQQTVHISNIKSYVRRDARYNSYLGGFGSLFSRYKIDNMLEEEGANVEHMEVVFASNDQTFDITSNLLHSTHNTKGRIIAKNVVKDKARSLFKGMIKIKKQASNSEAYLAGHAIILNKGAKADSIPGLEIENNEVKATHSASIAQMDEQQIFYLTARGFNKDEAKKFIVLGFVEPLLRRLSPETSALTKYLIENKWYGKPLVIRSDEVMNDLIEVERENKMREKDIFEKHYKYR